MIFRSEDSTLLFCESFRAKKPARGSVMIVHGMGEYAARYTEVADLFHSLGLDVHVMDLRGHGRSQGVRGHFESMSQIHGDIDAWIEHLKGEESFSRDKPCFLLGHSLGGLIATTYLAQYKVQAMGPQFEGLILSSPALGLSLNPIKVLEGKLAKHLPPFLRAIHVPNGISASDLTHDKEEIERYESDPLVHGWITPAAFLAIEDAISSLSKTFVHLDYKTLFLISGKDKVVDPRAAQKFAKKLSVAHPGQVEVKVFQSFFHESFHEAKRERAFLEVKKWVLQCLPKKSSAKNSLKSSANEAIAKAISR